MPPFCKHARVRLLDDDFQSGSLQHRATLEQLKPDEPCFYLDWFRTLPMSLDPDGLRAVHACWDEQSIFRITTDLEQQGAISPALVHSACKK